MIEEKTLKDIDDYVKENSEGKAFDEGIFLLKHKIEELSEISGEKRGDVFLQYFTWKSKQNR